DVAHRVHLAHAVLPELPGDVAAPRPRLHRRAELAGLGQQLEGDAEGSALERLRQHPDRPSHQITFNSSRNLTMRSWASPSSTTISPALRSSAAATSTICWPTAISTPRSAA